jgi:hypothetical protein
VARYDHSAHEVTDAGPVGGRAQRDRGYRHDLGIGRFAHHPAHLAADFVRWPSDLRIEYPMNREWEDMATTVVCCTTDRPACRGFLRDARITPMQDLAAGGLLSRDGRIAPGVPRDRVVGGGRS